MTVASMPAFLGAAGHAEGLMHVVTRHDPLEKKRLRWFSANFGMGKMEQNQERPSRKLGRTNANESLETGNFAKSATQVVGTPGMTPAVSSPMAGGVTPIARRGFTQCARVMCASRGAALVPWRCLSRPFETTRPSSAVHPRLRTSSPCAGIAGYTLVSRIFDPTTWLDRLATYHSARGVTTCAASSSAAGGTRGSVTHQLAAADAIASDTNDVDDPQSSIYPWYQRSFWVSQVTGPAVKQSARLMASRLDFDDPLGIDLTLRGASSSAATTSTETETEKGPPLKKKTTTKRKTLYDYALDVKRQHPKKVLLIRVGEFYEAIGFDAVILVMHAGLNPMGTTGVPKAGCPLVNVQETLDRLTSKGHNVVVCEGKYWGFPKS
jgi:hypothetical protein